MRYIVKLKYPEDHPPTKPLVVEFEQDEAFQELTRFTPIESLFDLDEEQNLVLPEGVTLKKITTDSGHTLLLEGEDYDLLPLGF